VADSVSESSFSRTICACALASLSLSASLGCRGRILAPSTTDATRQELATRTDERDAARARVSELETEVARLAAAQTPVIDPEAANATPALASVGISTLSAAILASAAPTDASAPHRATLTLVIVPLDGFGRVLQVVGTLKVTVATLIPGLPPLAAATLTLTPAPLRDAYRTGFLGTHYTIELPLDWDSPEAARAVAVSIEFTDALTGRAFPAAATIPLLPARNSVPSVGSR
jgi:hypothetical protein